MKTLKELDQVKIHSIQDKIFGVTFNDPDLGSDFFYEIYVCVPAGHSKPGAVYEEIKGLQTMKIASKGSFQTRGYAFQNMVQHIDELIRKAKS